MNGYISVRVGEVPDTIQEVMLNGERTVARALDEAGLEVGSREIRVNGDVASASTLLSEGATVLLVKKIKGA